MWTETLDGLTGLIGALAAFIVALTGMWGILRKVTKGQPGDAVDSGVEVPEPFDYAAGWRRERECACRLETDNDVLRSYVHKLDLVRTRNNIPCREERPWLTNVTPRSTTIRTMHSRSISTKRRTPKTTLTTSRRMKSSSLSRVPSRRMKTPPTRSPTRLRTKSQDRKSTRLNSSHVSISSAVFCLKKNKTTAVTRPR